MKFTSNLIAVKNMDARKQFYRDVLALNVVADSGANVTLDGELVRFYGPDKHIIEVWESDCRNILSALKNADARMYADKKAFYKKLREYTRNCR